MKQSCKTPRVYVIMPDTVYAVTAERSVYSRIKMTPQVKNFQEAMRGWDTFYYDLPSEGIALEEYLDYIVVSSGLTAKENLYEKIVVAGIKRNKGLILKPPINTKQLYKLDRLVVRFNQLHEHRQVEY